MMQDMAQPKRHVIASTDGVELAVHDHGGAGPTLVFCHATGLHGRVWDPVADALGVEPETFIDPPWGSR